MLMTTCISNAILMTVGNNTIKPQLCRNSGDLETGVGRQSGKRSGLSRWVLASLALGSVWLSGNFKLSFLSRALVFAFIFQLELFLG